MFKRIASPSFETFLKLSAFRIQANMSARMENRERREDSAK